MEKELTQKVEIKGYSKIWFVHLQKGDMAFYW